MPPTRVIMIMTHQFRFLFPLVRQAAVCCILSIACPADAVKGADQVVYPTADGTIVDGGSYGVFDGIGDAADWIFNESSYEGAIALSFPYPPMPGLERRVVFEYNLNVVTAQPPIVATLSFRLRGSTIFPAQPAGVEIYAYPADLLEQLSDFSAGPAVFIAEVFVVPFQTAALYEININSQVNEALGAGTKKVAFRFQIDPTTAPNSNQAFMDALDSNPATKPFITIHDRIPGDFDGDHDVDVNDYALMAPCITGPNQSIIQACRPFDADLDGDVDLADFSAFLQDMALYAR